MMKRSIPADFAEKPAKMLRTTRNMRSRCGSSIEPIPSTAPTSTTSIATGKGSCTSPTGGHSSVKRPMPAEFDDKPAKKPCTTRHVRFRGSVSVKTIPPVASTSTSSTAVAKNSSDLSIKGQGNAHPTVLEPSSTVNAVSSNPSKPYQTAINTQPIPELRRTGYGDARAFHESHMMAQQTSLALSKGLISEKVATNWSKSWHEKGVLETKWNDEHLLKDVKQEEIMDLKKVEANAKRKDAEEKKFLEDYFAEKIDEHGKRIGEETLVEKGPVYVSSMKTPRQKNLESAKAEAEKESLRPATLRQPTIQPPVAPKGPPLPAPTRPIQPARPRPHPQPPPPPILTAPSIPIALSGLPTYSEYGYYQLAAICFERNLVSGGGAFDLRKRLIQDDINVVKGLPRDAKPYTKEAKRARKHQAPVVLGAPKAPAAVYTGAKRGASRNKADGEGEMVGKKERMD